ncbi:MAG: 3-phosphoshikimate 1-carboxyvinyltransferase [Eubacterium sp.]
MSIVKIQNSILEGVITLPPSKSAAHRALVCSFLAGGGEVFPIIDSNDMKAMRQAIASLQNNDDIVDCIESGNTLRFIIPVAAALGKQVTFVGSGRLPERPIGDYLRLLPEHGVKCTCSGKLPLSIEGRLTSGRYEIAGNISSQYITGLLLALPILDGDSEIVLTTKLESKPYVDMTVKVMKDFGVSVEERENGYYIKGNQKYIKRDYRVESDWSQAAFFLAAGAINGDVALKGLDLNSAQGDKEIVNVLKRFGADIDINDGFIRCKKSKLRGIEVDVTDIPDTVPSIAVTAAFANGKTVIKGAERLRYKESDRIESVVTNLKKMGVAVEETRDGMIITGSSVKGAELDGYNDHRIVMAFSIAALSANGETTITQAESINKTYPSFFDDYNKLGGKSDVITIR